MSQKNVSKIVQCNTVSFSKNAHETGVQRYRSVSFCFVSYRSAEYRAESKCRSFRRRKTASLERLSLPSHVFHALDCLLAMKKSLAKPFLKMGVAPLVLWLARLTISASIVKAHKRNKTERNDTWDKTER